MDALSISASAIVCSSSSRIKRSSRVESAFEGFSPLSNIRLFLGVSNLSLSEFMNTLRKVGTLAFDSLIIACGVFETIHLKVKSGARQSRP